MVNCFLCSYEAQCISHLFIHFNLYHNLKSIDTFNCPLQDCLRIFNNIDTYKRHLKQHDFDFKSKTTINSQLTLNDNTTNAPMSVEDTTKYFNLNLNILDDIKQNDNIPPLDDFKNLRLNALSMICKWHSDTVIPRNKIDILIIDVQDFIDSIVSIFCFKINKCINKCCDTIVKDELSVVLSEMKVLSDPFVNMKSEYMRFETLDELGILIRPKEIVIGHRLGDKLIDGRVVLNPVEVKICLIPLRDIFKKSPRTLKFIRCNTKLYRKYEIEQ